jgi:glycerol-3-phosphate dehydrogenase (NAD(P)+)
MSFDRIAIIGAGAWGAALANAVARAGRSVTLVARDASTAKTIEATRASPRLADIRLDARVHVTSSGANAKPADAILLAVPSQHLRAAAVATASAVAPGAAVIACAKGTEHGTRKFMTEVIAEVLPAARPGILSGPSFAIDVARGLPTAVTLAVGDDATGADLARALGSVMFRPYHTTDLRGVEIGGAAKNVLAIAAGIVSGRDLGASAGAALITRGFAELTRFGQAYGARPETLVGLSGLGDLILTCSNSKSRNFWLGHALGQGAIPAVAQAQGQLAEGAFTAPVLIEMAREKKIDMPIAAAVAAILDGNASVDQAIEMLLARPFRAEG